MKSGRGDSGEGKEAGGRPVGKQRWPSLRFGVIVGDALYVFLLGVISLGNAVGPERWWWSTLNLYLPQYLWGLPGLALLPASAWLARRWTWLPVLCLAWVAVPLMGFYWPTSSLPNGEGTRLRVMSYNVKYFGRNAAAVMKEIVAAKPDLLLIQEAVGVPASAIGKELREWNVRTSGQHVIASRLPLSEPQLLSLSSLGEKYACLRSEFTVGSTRAVIYSVHLLTPRQGLAAVRHEGENGLWELDRNASARLQQATVLVDYVRRESAPLIVAGDLNAPSQSLVCRKLYDAGLQDAFSMAGRGYGYTYGHFLRLRHDYVRLDHILVNHRWRTLRCWTGGAEGSDHRPVIADLFLAEQPHLTDPSHE